MLLSGGAPTTPIPSLDLCFCGAKPRSGLITRALLLVVSPPPPSAAIPWKHVRVSQSCRGRGQGRARKHALYFFPVER